MNPSKYGAVNVFNHLVYINIDFLENLFIVLFHGTRFYRIELVYCECSRVVSYVLFAVKSKSVVSIYLVQASPVPWVMSSQISLFYSISVFFFRFWVVVKCVALVWRHIVGFSFVFNI